ncbi:GNAT family N-acetyltransferase [Rhodovulum sp. 12E13]|uniref:GNAT family N-acetyltransferase n=1 Tax=Rhodovulum sp. 12E13 TaxID=2203891 RepID=UPI0018F28718|nr:GNAT family N-acetyltransferase [Rhodovulum sp. 12E13]
MTARDGRPELVDLRSAGPARREAVLALNARHEVETSRLDAARLEAMLAAACLAPARADGAAFLIAFDERADYDSSNFAWFRARLDRFVYVDRVVVSEALRGRGVARALYGAVIDHARITGRGRVACEVNAVPPNPASDAFHAALGFREIGRGAFGPDKVVRYLVREVGAG